MTSRSALIEEGVVKSVHAKLIADRAPPQTGLIVGKREVGARDFILALVPSPDWNAEDGDGDSDRAPPGGGTPQAQRRRVRGGSVGRTAPGRNRAAPRGRPGRSVGDVRPTFNFVPPFAIGSKGDSAG